MNQNPGFQWQDALLAAVWQSKEEPHFLGVRHFRLALFCAAGPIDPKGVSPGPAPPYSPNVPMPSGGQQPRHGRFRVVQSGARILGSTTTGLRLRGLLADGKV